MSTDSTSRRTRPVVYRKATERITTMMWGLAVVAFGLGVIAWLDGYDFDLQLAGIITLAIFGLWILGSAIVSSINDKDD
jgi:4-hydroxybenzoate polyprenyltransferase